MTGPGVRVASTSDQSPAELHLGPDVSKANRAARSVWFLTAAAILALIVPLLCIAQVPNDAGMAAWWVTLLICSWSGFRLAWIIGKGAPALFEFFFWLFVYIFFGLAATVQIRSGDISSTTPGMSPSVEFPTALFIAASLVAFELGRLLVRRRPVRSDKDRMVPRGINPVASWILLVVGLLFMAYFVSKLGLSSFFQSRDTREAARSDTFSDPSTAAVIGALSWIPLLVACGAFTWRRRARMANGMSRKFGLIALGAALCVLVVVNPISGARFTSGTVLFALISYTGVFFRTVRRVRLALSGLIFAFLFLFPIADAFRGTTVSVSRGGFFIEYAGNPDYDSFWQIANAVSYVQQRGITWGGQFLGVLFFWVPRSIWANKPTDTGILLANFRGYTVTNLSAPVWAEAVVNGGRVFAVLVLAALGYLLVRLDRQLSVSLLAGGTGAIAGAIFPAYMIILLRGSMLQASGAFFVMVGSLLVIGIGGRSFTAAQLANRGVMPMTSHPTPAGGDSTARVTPSAHPALAASGSVIRGGHDGPIRPQFLLDGLQFPEPFDREAQEKEEVNSGQEAIGDEERVRRPQ